MFEQKSLVKKTTLRAAVAPTVLQQERELLSLGATHHWPFRVLGVAPVPTTAVYHNNWWLVPIAEDHSQIPARALERVQAIYEAGIRPKAFLILHEAPQQLPAPTDAPKGSALEFWVAKLAGYSVTAAKVTGTILSTAVVPLVISVLGVGALAALGFAAAILTDPCLIAVTDDDVWIQIDFWMA